MKSASGGLALALLAAPAWAAAGTTTGIATVIVILLVILGGFAGLAWLARRYLPGMGAQGVVRVIGAAMVGPRERVVVVEVEDVRLVLGVGSGQVRLLHTLPRSAPGVGSGASS